MAPKRAATERAQDAAASGRKRRIKIRTQVSESSSDESSESSDTSSPSEDSSSSEDQASEDDESTTRSPIQTTGNDEHTSGASLKAPAESKASSTTNGGFSAFYLRAVTSELAEDLDKIRSAQDFNESKMPMLIKALKQGEALFSDEEKKIMMQGRKD